MNISNKKILITVFVCLLLAGGIFALAYFEKLPKRNVQIGKQDTIAQLSAEQVDNSAQQNTQLDEQAGGQNNFQQIAPQNVQQMYQKNDSASQDQQSSGKDNSGSLVNNQKSSVISQQSSKSDSDAKSDSKIISRPVSWGFQKVSNRKIKAVIIHTSYNNLGGDQFDFDKVIQEWKDAGVSPHYAVDRGGNIYQLVADQNIAYHAGVSKLPDGTTDVNGASIGIEVVNTQDAKFTDAQYSALNYLLKVLKSKYDIKYILGHDEIAPGRKTDPWGIDWSKINK